jgi:hypothetical protein
MCILEFCFMIFSYHMYIGTSEVINDLKLYAGIYVNVYKNDAVYIRLSEV